MASKIGYAEADFKTLITEQKLYIDRTAYIQTMENVSNRNLIFVRPRRFGKSLWISILHYYYGVEHKAAFDTIFGNYKQLFTLGFYHYSYELKEAAEYYLLYRDLMAFWHERLPVKAGPRFVLLLAWMY